MDTAKALRSIIMFAATEGVSLVGKVAQVAHLLFPGHSLTNDQINEAEAVAAAEDDAIIARRRPMAEPDAPPATDAPPPPAPEG